MLFCSVLDIGIGCFCSILEGALELEDFLEEFLIFWPCLGALEHARLLSSES